MRPQCCWSIPATAGSSSRFFTETERWPYRIHRLVTPVTLTEPGGIVAELRRRGVESIDRLIISHWHADHIGGLLDFPQTPIHTHPEAWRSIQGRRGFSALNKAFLPGLAPPDAASRMRWLTEGSDLFGDGSMTALDLPGHAIGQIGIRFLSESGQPVLLAADACWVSEAYRENRMPHPVTRILHDWGAYRETLARLHALSRDEPELLIVPCHCPETAARIQTILPRA